MFECLTFLLQNSDACLTASVKRLLGQLGLNYVWLDQGCDNVWPFRLLKQRLRDAVDVYNTVEWENKQQY